jgi:hypothetical protein
MTKDYLQEAALVDLTDEELKEFLGYTYHAARNLEEAKKNDPEAQRLRDILDQYLDDNFNEEIKQHKANLKAARALAAARNVRWKLPDHSE